jgi:two-component system aerobic respiration control sensor histidine kinase ArcB
MIFKVSQIPKEYITKSNASYNPNYSISFSRRLKRDINKLTCSKDKILLVEDELAFQCIHKAALKKMGYNLDLAEDGEHAIRLFENNLYDLILLDIGLPDISGIEVGKIIRTHNKGRHIPILALTGYGKQVEPQCLEAGFDEVLPKPIQLRLLEKILKEKLEQKCSYSFSQREDKLLNH